jgi:tRNA A-37 threonylcarbamoyl transferase component Bud32
VDQSDSLSQASRRQLEHLIAQYLQAVKAGMPVDRVALLARHPHLANHLRAFFAAEDEGKKRGPSVAECDTPTLPLAPTVDGAKDSETLPPGDYATPANSPQSRPWQVGAPERSPAGTKLRDFGDYELLEEIARGGMGVVYKARQVSLNRIVALKMILAGQLASADDVRRFYSEAEAAANLSHPGIVSIYEVGQRDGQHFFSMGYVDGPTLAAELTKGPLPPPTAAELVMKIAEAVAYAHSQGVIHRDLKPGNVLLDKSGQPRVTDFGLAKRVEGGSDLTATGQVLGTPSYMPPEQAAGRMQDMGPAADVYALGAILYALLTGRPPFEAATALETLTQVLEQEPIAPRQLNKNIPRDLQTICLKCVEKERHRRYGSALELAEDLQRFLNGEPIHARPLGPLGRFFRWGRRHPALATTWVGLSILYLQHLVCLYVLQVPGEGGFFHGFITGLVLAWASGAAIFQSLLRRTGRRRLVTYSWALMDVFFFTTFLWMADGPRSALLSGYMLLMGGAALRAQAGLTWFITAACLASYLGISADAHHRRPELAVSASVSFYFLLSLLLMGSVLHLLRRRGRESPLE